MSEAGAALLVEGVEKSYGPVKALRGVDLAVRPGEFVVLLGPNGAGKTTLFQILSGLFVADGGRVSIDGFDMARTPVAALGRIGIVFQQPTLDLELSVNANLTFHARLHGLDRSETRRRIAGELDRFGLTERARDPVRDLSGGNKRRVELARALLHRPRFLLMDEATVGLDPASRRDILDHVRRLRDDGSTGILWATHLVDEATGADRVVVLDRGRVLFDGRPGALLAAAADQSGAAPADLEAAFLALVDGARDRDGARAA